MLQTQIDIFKRFNTWLGQQFYKAPVTFYRDVRFAGPAPFIDVRAYGAKAMGTDDKTAIQAAVNAVPSSGGTVYFPTGWYTIGSSIVINSRNNLHLQGAGRTGTGLIVGGSFPAITISGVCSYVSVRDMLLYSTAARANSMGISATGTSGTHSDHINVIDVTVQNLAESIAYDYVDQFSVERVHILQSVASACVRAMRFQRSINGIIKDFMTTVTTGSFPAEILLVDGDTDSLVFQNGTLLDGVGYGMRLANTIGGATGPRLIRVDNVQVESCGESGFIVSDGRDIRFNGCHSAVNTGAGFEITGGDSVCLQNSLALQNGRHGFHVTGGDGVGLVGCTASNNSQTTSDTYSGIYVDVNGVRVSANRSGDFFFTLTNKQKYGLVIAATRDYETVVGNDFRGNNTAALLNASAETHNITEHNQT